MTLPAHTPTADILVCTYGEPDAFALDSPLNTTKVGSAYSAFLTYVEQVITGDDMVTNGPDLDQRWAGLNAETLISDLIADLLHLATYTGCDTEQVLHRAQRDFQAEAGRGYDQ